MFYFGVWGDNILFVYGSVLGVFLVPIPVLIVSLTLCVPRMASPSKAMRVRVAEWGQGVCECLSCVRAAVMSQKGTLQPYRHRQQSAGPWCKRNV